MLRPERMSKVSVTGSKAVMADVVEATYDLNLVHLSDYDGRWEGFEPGDTAAGSDETSETLVTVRSLETILDVDEDEVEPGQVRVDEVSDERIEEIREEVNALDDRRTELRDELRSVEERVDAVEPFSELGIDLDLLSGYDSIRVAVGESDEDAVRAALSDADAIDEFGTFSGGDVVAAFARPTPDAGPDALTEALVGIEFANAEVPDAEGSPGEYLSELRHRSRQLESELATVENELEELRLDAAGFLLATEEYLTVEAQKAEVPLRFATTERSFIAEGWIPTDRYDELERALERAVGDRIEIEELERADYDDTGHATRVEAVDHASVEESDAADEEESEEVEQEPPKAATDGGAVSMTDEPPVIQDNADPAKPFELLLRMINRPKYTELDPTIVLLLTFPAFYGFMIGDLGYGLIYIGAGYLMYSRFDSDAIRSLGAIGMWAGGFTMLFGVLYGEVFGLHVLGEVLFGGSPPLHKGLQPAFLSYGQAWLIVSLLLGLLHLTLGYVFGFINDLDHGVAGSYFENGSWAVLMLGLWIWIFSRHARGTKPDFLFTTFGSGSEAAYALGFAGLSAEVGLYVGVPLLVVGLVTMVYGEVQQFGPLGVLVGLLESFNALGDVLSYLRIAAVILAKAGMAFVVNLLFFGVYVTEEGSGEVWHFGMSHAPAHMLEQGTYHGHEVTEVMFGGLLHGGVIATIAGVFILVVGHLVVLLLGITSAGLQGIRLEYVEFFEKFYEGGGRAFEPFGYERKYTTDD